MKANQYDEKLFGTRLKSIREQRMIKTKTMAKKLDIVHGSYNAIESGNRFVSLNMFIDICNIFQVSSDYFLEDYLTFKTDGSEELSKLMVEMSPKEIETCIKLMNRLLEYKIRTLS